MEEYKEEFQKVLDEYLASEEYKPSTPSSDGSPDRNEFYAFDSPPEPIKTVAPDYPEASKFVGATGTVHVEVTVNVIGEVVAARIVKSNAGKYLDKEALKAAKQWQFKPARNKGVPVKVKIVIPFDFKKN